jgi:hypothetical protein
MPEEDILSKQQNVSILREFSGRWPANQWPWQKEIERCEFHSKRYCGRHFVHG